MIATSPDASGTALPCAWCGNLLMPPRGRTPWLLRCAACGVLTVPQPSRPLLTAPPADARGDSRHRHRLCTLGEAARRSARRHLANRVARVAPPGPVLAVAGGDGRLVEALRAAGRLATGVVGRVAGAPPAAGQLADADITELGGRYAAIVFWQSLGRLQAPGAALDHAAALLKPGGLLTVAQPSLARLQARALGERLLTAEPPRERALIPPQALVQRLLALGLQVDAVDDRIDRRAPGGWLHGVLGGMTTIEARR